jgi:hypothetical protein
VDGRAGADLDDLLWLGPEVIIVAVIGQPGDLVLTPSQFLYQGS